MHTRTRIKICGLKEAEHVHTAVSAGADAIGLVFYPPSSRNIELAAARALRPHIPAFVSCVALVVNPTAAQVLEIIQSVQPDLLQFHGDEPPEFCAQFGRPYVKAAPIQTAEDLVNLRRRYSSAAAWLADTPSDGFGGSGKVFDWSLISTNDNAGRLVLSGGLSYANVREAIARVRPFAVDVSSGVESAKGVKDSAKIEDFCRAVRLADVANAADLAGNQT
jgi:phosphoribosylanthranilate isomerase